MKIAFLVPDNGIGGGLFVIYEHAKRLKLRGHDVVLVFAQPSASTELPYPGMTGMRTTSIDELPKSHKFDVVFATWWETAYLLSRVNSRHYAYLIQGFESNFYPENEHIYPFLVEQTYRQGLHIFVVTKALRNHIFEKTGQEPVVIPNAVNLDDFSSCSPLLAPTPGRLRVLVEGRPGAAIKRIPLAFEVLAHFPELEVVFLSAGGKPKSDWKVDHFFESIHYADVPPIHRSCDFILKLSSEESFALPVLESFAAGATAVVSQFNGHDEYIRHEDNALVVPIDNLQGAIAAVRRLAEDPHLLSRLKKSALATAQTFSWEKSNALLEATLVEILQKDDRCKKLSLHRGESALKALRQLKVDFAHVQQKENQMSLQARDLAKRLEELNKSLKSKEQELEDLNAQMQRLQALNAQLESEVLSAKSFKPLVESQTT